VYAWLANGLFGSIRYRASPFQPALWAAATECCVQEPFPGTPPPDAAVTLVVQRKSARSSSGLPGPARAGAVQSLPPDSKTVLPSRARRGRAHPAPAMGLARDQLAPPSLECAWCSQN
jgi:hypothetical protein